MPNKLSQFWHELKRRNVTRVLAVYIAAAFMILELVDMTTEPFGLPDWSMKVAFFCLLAGLIVAVIISWIYDIHPEGGMVRTEPVEDVKPEEILKSSNSWRIASYISFLVIVGLIILNIIPRANNNRNVLEKSIAVLPLEYLSADPNNEYLANGVLEAITGHLSMIEGLRIMPRISVEQYRNEEKTAKEIGEELNVSYLIVGSFLMIEDQVKLTIQLVVADEGDNILFKEYDMSYKDIFDVQSEIAQLVAKEVGASISPSEKQRIEKIPTNNSEAYNYYLRGREEVIMNSGFYRIADSRSKAKSLFQRSLELDSTFALAYAGLGWVYMYENESEIVYLGVHSDSALYYVEKALSFDDQLGDAYEIRGDYYRLAGDFDLSEADLKRAIDISPSSGFAYHTLARLYINYQDYIPGLSNLHKAASLSTGEMLESILTNMGGVYAQLGFGDLAKSYSTQVLNLNGDSLAYFRALSFIEWNNGNIRERLKYENWISGLNPSSARDLIIGNCYSFINDYKHAVFHYEKYIEEKGESSGEILVNYHRLAYSYSQLDFEDKAEYFYNKQIEICIEAEMTGSYYFISGQGPYDLAGVYAATGQKTKSLEYLRLVNEIETCPAWGYHLISLDPLFDSIRDDPELQKIFHDIQTKHVAEHERVRQWLEENDML